MLKLGCLARFFNRYKDEVEFAKANGFDFMQLWYDNNGFSFHEDDENPIELINEFGFPTIIHAVLNINEFEEHIPKLREILKKLGHKELIIHPISDNSPITEHSLDELIEQIDFALKELSKDDVVIYLENNSKLNPIFTETEEIEKMFGVHNNLEFLLDIAHIDGLDHLKAMVTAKKPKVLHIADKHFDILHEHLPIGDGEIDFETIFKDILINFDGKIVFEVVETDEDIVKSKNTIERIIKNS
jgi:sugar phosphate isomerase/epimerase